MKLLYLADREAILRWGSPVTTDCFVAMNHGPVLSRIYTLVSEGDDPRKEPSVWSAAITRLQDWDVALKDAIDPRQLSKAESGLLDEIFQEHGLKTQWDLADLTRGLPEWRDPKGSAVPFRVQDILAADNCARAPCSEDEEDLEGACLNFFW
jgi:uncharacterized phage-associated protein